MPSLHSAACAIAVCFPIAVFPASAGTEEDAHRAAGRIRPLLAAETGGAVCFHGAFTDLKVNVWDYAKAKQVPVPGLFRFGEQVTRPEPLVHEGQEVRSMTLVLEHDGRQHEHWDELHTFRLAVSLAGWPAMLRAGGECLARFTDRAIEGAHDPASVTTTTLRCGIDCDGGLMEVEREPGSDAVVFRFDAHGLRMTEGCSGRNSYHVGGQAKPYDEGSRNAHKPVSFRLTPMPASACSAARKRVR